MKPNAHAYCELSYNSLKQNMHHWGDPDWTRPLTRTFYNFMFGAGTNPTGFISEAALNNKLNKQKTCFKKQVFFIKRDLVSLIFLIK